MVDSEYSTDNYLGAIIQNPEMLKLVPDKLKT